MQHNKLPLKEKIAYGIGDFGFSMFWKLFSAYILFFYTDVFGITAAAAGTMFLVTRIWDTANDPIMGMIGDRTKSKWGKFRPYLLYFAVPFGIVGIITFSTPDMSASGKLIYAYVTYTLMMMVYTACNVPYASLLGVMSDSSHDRTSLATWRYIGGYLGGLLVTTTANYLFEYFSGYQTSAISNGGNPVITSEGYQYTIAVYAILTTIALLITFKGVKERVAERKELQSSIKGDLSDLIKNVPWLLMLGVVVFGILGGTVKDGIILFYTKYYLGAQEIIFLGKVSQSEIASI
ncbi:MAG: MFS transporter, partial [Gammaproteobacteria bacterium]|nr:MFS transporter [Gammaproteobacteria bacterium]